MSDQKPGEAQGKKPDTGTKLHIFVNRRKFANPPDSRVSSRMSGSEIAALVDIPAQNAVVHRGNDGSGPEVPLDEKVYVKNGDHFVATRRQVDGGYCANVT
ncbi:MAG: hypothetical protein R3B35_10005 [Gemmatimonadales bacterium]